MQLVPVEDMDFFAQQSSGKLNMIISVDCTMNSVKFSTMKDDKQEKCKISNDLLDAIARRGKSAGRFVGQRGHHHSVHHHCPCRMC